MADTVDEKIKVAEEQAIIRKLTSYVQRVTVSLDSFKIDVKGTLLFKDAILDSGMEVLNEELTITGDATE